MSSAPDPAGDDLPPWRVRWDELNRQPYFRRASPSTLRAAWWALRSVKRARRELRADGVHATVAPPPDVAWGARTGVYGVLQRLDPTCVERSLVQQAWLHAFGVERAVVIGVRVGAQDFRAHAWIEHMTAPEETAPYTVIHRLTVDGRDTAG